MSALCVICLNKHVRKILICLIFVQFTVFICIFVYIFSAFKYILYVLLQADLNMCMCLLVYISGSWPPPFRCAPYHQHYNLHTLVLSVFNSLVLQTYCEIIHTMWVCRALWCTYICMYVCMYTNICHTPLQIGVIMSVYPQQALHMYIISVWLHMCINTRITCVLQQAFAI